MNQQLNYFYLKNNPDWDNKIKFGYVFGTERTELSQCTTIYGFQKPKNINV
jgi:hypothetical protein